MEVTAAARATKEGVEHDLLQGAAHGQQCAHKARQRAFARADEGVGKFNVPRIGGKLGGVDSLGELVERIDWG
jgi:hypothetical protein